MRFFGKTTIDFMRRRNLWYTVSAAVILAGFVSLAIKGLDLGIDFLGGTELIIEFQQPTSIADIRAAMTRGGFTSAEIKTYGTERQVAIRVREEEGGAGVSERIRQELQRGFPGNPFIVMKEDRVGPKIGAELRRDAIYALVASLIAILLYIAFRFKFIYGVGAVAALLHDVLVALGLVSIFGGLSPWLNLEISQNMVAAFLTLVGLSVNDTVVIFDRIRENQKIFRSMGLMETINKSLNETLSRTVITQGTVVLVLVVLLFFGGDVNRGFAFALVVGTITGTYSSVYIASAIVLDWSNRTRKVAKLID